VFPYALVPHALVGTAVVVGGLALSTYAFYQKASAADARADAAVAVAEELKQTLVESESQNAELRQRRKDLDALIRERDSRVQNLEAENKSRDEAYDKLRAEVPKEDQDCLGRPLPPALAERLRN
jgi:parvulin-like peptidyl-prolyl isomerase